MKKGYLKFNEVTGRYHFWLADPRGCYYPEYPLHCGDCFEVKIKGKWKPTRIEASGVRNYADMYYLVGTRLHGRELEDLEVRM